MKKNIIITLFGIGILIFGFATSLAAVPQNINYQGILRDSAGNLQNGTFSMTFKIYNAESGGTPVYTSPATNVPVSNGLYNVELPADASVFDGSPKYLEVTVGTDTLTPRLKINSVAYAITADYATTAGTATTAASAASADYATLSGQATEAANALLLDTFNASTTPGENQIPVTDGSGRINAEIFAEAHGSNLFALFVNGRLGATAGSGINPGTVACGSGTILNGSASTTITNGAVSPSSIILITVGPTDDTIAADKWIKVSARSSNSFTVKTRDGINTLVDIPFWYLIIN